MAINDERIFVTRDPDSQGHQAASKKGTWSTKIDLYMSDDLFKTDQLILEGGNTMVKAGSFMYIACSHADEQRVRIYSSNYKTGFKKVSRVRLP